jgi:hypothetical protein
MAGVADAYWTATGTGGGSGPVGTLNAPTISSATPGAGTATLNWTAVTPPGSGSVSYYVTRNGGSPAGNCPTQAAPTTVLTCSDSGLSPGTYSYTVTAVWRVWTATSSPATQVTVIGPPVNTALPVITGTATQGQVLSTTNGTWTNSPTGYTHQWRRCDSAGANCSNISGATSGTYTLVYADAGSTIRVVVTATNPYGSTPATSARYPASGTVTGLAPVNTVLPIITGTATQGQVLSTTNGTWTNSPTGYTYQWRHCDSAGANCADISGATSGTYTLVYADAGFTLRVVVTATNPYGSTPATSAQYPASGTVAGLAPVNTALPVISGTATQGQVLSTTNGTWTNSPTGYTYQWRRCDSAGNTCSNISGATSGTYTLVYADAGSTIRAVATATNPYGSTPATSAQYPASGTVTGLAPVNTALPVISGIAAVGQTLSTTNGTWTNSPTSYTYQWRRCDSAGNTCSNISAATSGTYTLVHADAGFTIRVVVTATNPYGSTPATSARYPAAVTVTEFAPVNTALPVIIGTAAVGNTLSTDDGTWTNSPTSYTYQWRSCNGGGQQCSDITGATAKDYIVQSADSGNTLRVVVTAINASGSSIPATSDHTGKV